MSYLFQSISESCFSEKKLQLFRRLLACIFILQCIPLADATTILGMDIDQLARDAEFIFEGEVIAIQSRQDNGDIISTYVTFTVSEVIKGDANRDTIELEFLGGSIDGRMTQVSGLTLPGLGEQGIYFVESTSRDLVNPLLGWSQGHFLINADRDGTLRISTVDNKPVSQVQSVSSIPQSIKRPQAIIEDNSQVAAGITTQSSALMIDRALTVDEFKARIRELIEN
jgi:hypothetical protein